jgi:hypothetical protein
VTDIRFIDGPWDDAHFTLPVDPSHVSARIYLHRVRAERLGRKIEDFGVPLGVEALMCDVGQHALSYRDHPYEKTYLPDGALRFRWAP